MDLSHLTDLANRYSLEQTGPALPALGVLRREAVSDIEAALYEPVICLILQGSKMVSVGDQAVEIGPGDALLVSHDLPVVSRITRASRQEPYLALILMLDLSLVRGLYGQVSGAPTARAPPLPDGPRSGRGSRRA